MKLTTKNIVMAFIAFGLLIATSSCSHHTCPTYSQTQSQQHEAKA